MTGDVHAACPLGTHVASVRRIDLRLEWYLTVPDGERLRVLEHTCGCQDPSYEYGTCGGAYRIRRTTYTPRGVDVHQTPATRRATAVVWWRQLLDGRAL